MDERLLQWFQISKIIVWHMINRKISDLIIGQNNFKISDGVNSPTWLKGIGYAPLGFTPLKIRYIYISWLLGPSVPNNIFKVGYMLGNNISSKN